MNSVMNTVLKQMDYFDKYKYPSEKWSKVYPYASVEGAEVDFSSLSCEDIYAYYAGDMFHILFSDDDYQYHVAIQNKFVN